MDRWRASIGVIVASLVFVAAICWFAAIVHTVGILVGKPWMLGHGLVNDALLITAEVVLIGVDFCVWKIIRHSVDSYLKRTG